MKKLLALLVLAGLALVVLAWWVSRRSAGDAKEEYAVAPIEWGSMNESVGATGGVQPREIMVVSSPLSGQVVEVYPTADVNKVVQEGDALLRLDDRPAKEKLEQAEAQLQQAEADVKRAEAQREVAQLDLTRAKQLATDNLAAQRDVRKAEQQLLAAEATLTAARAKVAEAKVGVSSAQLGLEFTIVRVPRRVGSQTNGGSENRPGYTIIERKVTLGQLVAPPASAQLFTLAGDLGLMQVLAQVSEDDIGKIRAGMPASFTVYAFPEGARFRGTVTEIRPMPTRVQGLVFYETVIEVKNERAPGSNEWKLRPGMTASVDIILRTHADVWKMPRAALEYQPDERQRSDAARAKLAEWQKREDRDQWRAVWIRDAQGKPWPVMVRLGGTNPAGEPAIADSRFNEVLEWEPEVAKGLDPAKPATYPRVIISGPPAKEPGWLEAPKVRIF